MRRYIVLRNLAARGTAEPSDVGVRTSRRTFSRARGLELDDIPEPMLESFVGTAREAEAVSRERDVEGVSPDMLTSLIEPITTNLVAAEAGSTWGISAVKADTSPRTGEGVVVAVLDTGIDAQHAAFQGIDLVQKDFTGTSIGDGNGHGTHCAGTIFGRNVDGQRIGIAHGVKKALIGKVLKDNGRGTSDMIFEGMKWAVQEGAQVVSMSIGFDFSKTVQRALDEGLPLSVATAQALEAYRGNLRMFDTLMDMIRANEAFGKGAVVVAASGNESQSQLDPRFKVAASVPSAAQGVISVGALMQTAAGMGVANFSNTLPQLSAPGVAVLSAKTGGGLTAKSGTSMACPHVAGVAALWWEELRKRGVRVTPALVVSRLLNAQLGVFAPGSAKEDFGAGLVVAPQ
jgi:subtilisin family serine protease